MSKVLKPWEQYRVEPGRGIRLDAVAADSTTLCPDKDTARTQLKRYRSAIDDLGRAPKKKRPTATIAR